MCEAKSSKSIEGLQVDEVSPVKYDRAMMLHKKVSGNYLTFDNNLQNRRYSLLLEGQMCIEIAIFGLS